MRKHSYNNLTSGCKMIQTWRRGSTWQYTTIATHIHKSITGSHGEAHLDTLLAIVLMNGTKTIPFDAANTHALNNPFSLRQTCRWAFGVCEHWTQAEKRAACLFIYLILKSEETRGENEVPDTHFWWVHLWPWNSELPVKEWRDGEMSFE